MAWKGLVNSTAYTGIPEFGLLLLHSLRRLCLFWKKLCLSLSWLHSNIAYEQKIRFRFYPEFLLMAYAGFCSGSQKSELSRFLITFNRLQKGKTRDSHKVYVLRSTIWILMMNVFIQIPRWWRLSVCDNMSEFEWS